MVKKKTKYTHVSEVMYIITKTYYFRLKRNDCILDLRYCSVHNRFKSLSVKTTKLKRASKMILPEIWQLKDFTAAEQKQIWFGEKKNLGAAVGSCKYFALFGPAASKIK